MGTFRNGLLIEPLVGVHPETPDETRVDFTSETSWNHHVGFRFALPDLQIYFPFFVPNVATRPCINSFFSLSDNLASGWGIK